MTPSWLFSAAPNYSHSPFLYPGINGDIYNDLFFLFEGSNMLFDFCKSVQDILLEHQTQNHYNQNLIFLFLYINKHVVCDTSISYNLHRN